MIKSRNEYYKQKIKHHLELAEYHLYKSKEEDYDYHKEKEKQHKALAENLNTRLSVKTAPLAALPYSDVSPETKDNFNDDDICEVCSGMYKDHPTKHTFQLKKAMELTVGTRVIEKDHHGDTGTIKAIFPEEGSTKMYCKVQWDNGTTADYFLDDMEPVMEQGQQEIKQESEPKLDKAFNDEDMCICGDMYKEHLDKNKFKLKKDIAAISTTMAPPIA